MCVGGGGGFSESSVLRVYLGMVLHANKRYVEALDMLGAASKTEPTNPQVGWARIEMKAYSPVKTQPLLRSRGRKR